jgi:hypothetical protein
MEKELRELLGIVSFLLIGVVCLRWPHKIQQFAIKHSFKHGPFLMYVKSGAYILSTRAIGAVSLAVALLLTYVCILSLH